MTAGTAMTTRPTTLVESDLLAKAAANILSKDDLVPKGKRWPFARSSRAHREYEKAVQQIAARRQASRTKAVEQKNKLAKAEADNLLERALKSAEAARDEEAAEAKKPYDAVEAQARAERDAVIASAKLAYQQAVAAASRTYEELAASINQQRDVVIEQAKVLHRESYAALESERQADLAKVARELKSIPLEGPMRIIEDRQAWSLEARRKALAGLIDLAGVDDLEIEQAELCLRNVAGYVFQDRHLPAEAQHQKLMAASLLEALVAVALRNRRRRPLVVHCIHEIVIENPGHSSPALIRSLTHLYVDASADTQTLYSQDAVENETIVETMRAQIADTLKLTPRRSLVPPAPEASRSAATRAASELAGKQEAPTAAVREVTADVELGELVPVELDDALQLEANRTEQGDALPRESRSKRAPPLRRLNTSRPPEDST